MVYVVHETLVPLISALVWFTGGWEHNGTLDCGGYPRPEELDVDYGTPLGLCKETETGVFTREFTKSTITMDCNTYTPTIHMHGHADNQ